MNDRDHRLVEAVDLIGPVSIYSLAFHAAADEFDTRDELEDRLDALIAEGYLRRRALPGVTGESVIECETIKNTGE